MMLKNISAGGKFAKYTKKRKTSIMSMGEDLDQIHTQKSSVKGWSDGRQREPLSPVKLKTMGSYQLNSEDNRIVDNEAN